MPKLIALLLTLLLGACATPDTSRYGLTGGAEETPVADTEYDISASLNGLSSPAAGKPVLVARALRMVDFPVAGRRYSMRWPETVAYAVDASRIGRNTIATLTSFRQREPDKPFIRLPPIFIDACSASRDGGSDASMSTLRPGFASLAVHGLEAQGWFGARGDYANGRLSAWIEETDTGQAVSLLLTVTRPLH